MDTAEKQDGFSLVELVIAVSLVGVIVMIVGNIPNAIRLVTSSQSESLVRQIAAKKIEDVRAAGYESLPEQGTTNITDSRLGQLNNSAAFMVVDECPATICTADEEVRQVTLTISWSEEGEPKTYQIVTLIGEDGLR
jgi:prepilin-type N-terminal cleavage/methylation domain-containing protein